MVRMHGRMGEKKHNMTGRTVGGWNTITQTKSN